MKLRNPEYWLGAAVGIAMGSLSPFPLVVNLLVVLSAFLWYQLLQKAADFFAGRRKSSA